MGSRRPANPQGPSYVGLSPANARASAAAKASSKKKDTSCELKLRRALWRLGLRFRTSRPDIPGKPDIIFGRARVLVFCDGDFWHGRDLDARLSRLEGGHNPRYWVAKIRRNAERDRATTRVLEGQGWLVLRFWETDINKNTGMIAQQIRELVEARRYGG